MCDCAIAEPDIGPVAATIMVLTGAIVGFLSAYGWKRFKLLHLAPFAYAFAVYGVEVGIGTLSVSRWDMPIILGSVYYGLGWVQIASERLDEIARRKENERRAGPHGPPRDRIS